MGYPEHRTAADQRVRLWLTPATNDAMTPPDAPTTVAESALSFSSPCVWAEGHFLARNEWMLTSDGVLPRVTDLAVALISASVGVRDCLLEVVWTSDAADHLNSAPEPNAFTDSATGSPTAVFLVHREQLRFWLDMLMGMGYPWSLASPGIDSGDFSAMDEGRMLEDLRGADVCVTEHDGLVVQFSVREPESAQVLHRALEQLVRESECQSIEGP